MQGFSRARDPWMSEHRALSLGEPRCNAGDIYTAV